MTRNLDRRVEVDIYFDKNIEKTLHGQIQWKDNVKARLIQPPYNNNYVTNEEVQYRSQDKLFDLFLDLILLKQIH